MHALAHAPPSPHEHAPIIVSKMPLASGWIVLQHVWQPAPASTHSGSVTTTSAPASLDPSTAASLAVASTPASVDELDPHANKKLAQTSARPHRASGASEDGTNRILES